MRRVLLVRLYQAYRRMTNDPQLRATYEKCVEQHAESLYRVAYRLLGNSDHATELVQETYLQAWKSLDQLRNRNQIKSWMFRILRNQYTKQIRHLSRVTQLESPAEISERQEPSDTTELIQLGISKLDSKHKLPILLVSMEGLSIDEAAEALSLPRGTVLSRLHRARQELKIILERLKIHEPNG